MKDQWNEEVFFWKTTENLVQLTKQREKIQIKSVKKGNTTTDTTEIQRVIREYSEYLYAKKFDNQEEMDWLIKNWIEK
jgi:hypothetical protein